MPVGLFHSCSCCCCSSVMFNLFIAVNIHCLDMVTYLVGGLKEIKQTNVRLQRERNRIEKGRDSYLKNDSNEKNKTPDFWEKSFKWNRWTKMLYILIAMAIFTQTYSTQCTQWRTKHTIKISSEKPLQFLFQVNKNFVQNNYKRCSIFNIAVYGQLKSYYAFFTFSSYLTM